MKEECRARRYVCASPCLELKIQRMTHVEKRRFCTSLTSRTNFEFCPPIRLLTMIARDARTERGRMEKRRRPQHWLLQLVKVAPLCCLLMKCPATAFSTRPFSARQHVSLRVTPHQGRHLFRQQRSYLPRNKRSDLSMTVRKMVRKRKLPNCEGRALWCPLISVMFAHYLSTLSVAPRECSSLFG